VTTVSKTKVFTH